MKPITILILLTLTGCTLPLKNDMVLVDSVTAGTYKACLVKRYWHKEPLSNKFSENKINNPNRWILNDNTVVLESDFKVIGECDEI